MKLSVKGCLLALVAVASASSSCSDGGLCAKRDDSISTLVSRDGHGHGHGGHGSPLMMINETKILEWHKPTPPSYYDHDFLAGPDKEKFGGWMLVHVLSMSAAFFGALPFAIILRSVKSSWHTAAMLSFYGLTVFGCISSSIYTKLTPNLYEGNKHGSMGYLFILASLSLSFYDFVLLVRRIVAYFRTEDKFAVGSFYQLAVLGKNQHIAVSEHEYSNLLHKEGENHQLAESPIEVDHEPQWERNWVGRQSTHSDRTLLSSPTHEDFPTAKVEKQPFVWRAAKFLVGFTERFLIFAGFVQVLSGVAVYTGGCRDSYVHGCAAHMIKGGIFWCYGLVTFARFLGAFADFGWAWNKPRKSYLTAEFTECAVIFLYGATNTWMERFDAQPGDPFTTKQLQHISIAVMFWFSGLIGMALESKTVRRWITLPSESNKEETNEHKPSFNPFPALTIGVTGAAMSAHHQEYVFQVQIHALWGYLLVGFAFLRCFTYFFAWVKSSLSYTPSRPPTEALAAFSLACGGLVFILSTEEITFAAMRQGRDDIMFILNLSVAFTCIALIWVFSLVTAKGYLRHKLQRRPISNAS